MNKLKKENTAKKLAVIGSGIVGQATGKGFISKGHDVVFCDINPETLAKLKNKGYKAYSPNLLAKERDIKAFFLSVSTPTVNGKIRLDFLKSAATDLAKGALKGNKSYCIVVVRSTVPPGTTEELIVPILEKYSRKKAGKDFGVCMNPEYLRENSNEKDFNNPWIIIIGELDAKSGNMLKEIYGKQNCPVVLIPIKEAEIQKYIHNLFNACKISFFNEMRMVCDSIKVNTDKVFDLVAQSAESCWNPRYGTRNLGPFSGSCLPKDTSAFLDWAKSKLKNPMLLLDNVIKVNEIIKEKYKDLK